MPTTRPRRAATGRSASDWSQEPHNGIRGPGAQLALPGSPGAGRCPRPPFPAPPFRLGSEIPNLNWGIRGPPIQGGHVQISQIPGEEGYIRWIGEGGPPPLGVWAWQPHPHAPPGRTLPPVRSAAGQPGTVAPRAPALRPGNVTSRAAEQADGGPSIRGRPGDSFSTAPARILPRSP